MLTLESINLDKITDSQLGEMLIEAKKAYYSGGRPIMDDPTYDTLEEILRQRNPHHRIFSKVGTKNFDTGWTKKKHFHPMNSQNKVTSFNDLVHYFQLKKISSDTKFAIQPKCDGLSLELIYQKGQLADAITRGDGRVGDCITQNVVRMKNFVEKLPEAFTGSIRCEIVVTRDDFTELPGEYSNPRNAASGIAQRLDSQYSEFCSLVAVDITTNLDTETDKVKYLKELGIVTVDNYQSQGFDKIESIYQQFLQQRQQYPFDIDGLVIKIDNHNLAQALGSQNNRPKYQVAYKFPANTNQSKLIDVNWQVGPMGSITPVAQIEPIEVAGAIISYISLANIDLIKGLNLDIGDIVEVSRRGDVIPHIEKVVIKNHIRDIELPTHCPSCHSQLVKDGKFTKCPNRYDCPAQNLGTLKLFCKKLDILGISDKTIDKLSAKVKLPGDFYDLTVNDFIPIDGLGEKSGNNIVSQIQSKRLLSLVQIFDSATIPSFSAKRVDQVIRSGFDTPDKIIHLSIPDLMSIPGFKVTLATKIVDGIAQRREVIQSILSHVTVILDDNIKSNTLANLRFCITGELSKPRKEIENIIINNGGQVQSTVSSNTSYLITNLIDSNSSKFKLARKIGVKILSEDDLYQLVK